MREMHWAQIRSQIAAVLPDLDDALKKSDIFKNYPWVLVDNLADLLIQRSDQQAQARFPGKTVPPEVDNYVTGTYRAISIYKAFQLQGEHVFKIAGEFGKALERVNLKVDPKYLPFDSLFRCIEFPDDVSFDMKDGDYARVVYVAAFQPDAKILLEGEEYVRRIDVLVPLSRAENEGIPHALGHDNIRVFFKDGETLEQAVTRSIARSSSPTGLSLELVNYILKCLLYIHSGDPDLREFKPQPKPHNQKRLKRWRRENLCAIPITLVGFDYKKPREYSADKTWVETFPRWQPYGPNSSKVKLIWVRAHERHFKKGGTGESSEPTS